MNAAASPGLIESFRAIHVGALSDALDAMGTEGILLNLKLCRSGVRYTYQPKELAFGADRGERNSELGKT